MKKILLFVAYTAGSTLLVAQNPSGTAGTTPHKGNGHIFGIAKDSITQLPIEFANVALIDLNSNKPVDGTVCDEKGKFSLNKVAMGNYSVVISFIGLQTRTIPNVIISDKKTEIDLGVIIIAPVAKLLKEVVVEGQKSLVEEKVDRTVYNAENDQTTKGGDATDVLKRVPMLSVDMDGNPSLRGSQNIKVLINNKPSTITAGSVADALKQIPADQIKTVEVITSPSAKYDAEGSAGIINIITKKNTLQGFSLNADGSSGYRGSNLGLHGGYRKGKMGFSLGGFGRAGYNVHGSFENNQLTTFTSPLNTLVTTLNTQNATTHRNDLGGNYTLGWDYDIDKNNSLTASMRLGGRNNFSYQDHLLTQTFQSDILSNTSTRNVKTTDLSNTLDMNLNYTHTFAKPQREFSLMTLYSRNNRTNDFASSTLSVQEIDSARTKNINNSYNQEIAIQADYQTPIGSTQILEMGGKNTTRQVSSNYSYFVASGTDGVYSPNPNPQQTANVFSYNQNIAAGYLAYTLSLPAGYSFKAGSRYEYTTINANFKNAAASEGNTDIPTYGVLVPSANFSKKLKSGNVLKLAYNRRIQRPSIQFLNPNQQFSNQLSVSQGNTHLGPEYTNNYELAYSMYIGGSSLNFSSFMRNTNNSIQSIREPYKNSQDTILTTYKNIGKEDAYGLSVFTGINISNKFSLNGGGDVFYAVLKNNDPIPQYTASNQGWVYNVRMFGNYTIGNGWGAQFFGFYRGRQVQLQGFQGGFGVYSLGFRKDFNKKKGSIGFGAENFFAGGITIRNSVTSPLVDQHSQTVLHNMNFKITFSYRIGKMTFDALRKRKKSISDDDLKEAGDNNPANATQQQQQQGSTPGQGQGGQQGGTGEGGKGRPTGKPAQGQWQKQNPIKQDSLKQDLIRRDSIKRDSTMQNWKKPDSIKQDSIRQKRSPKKENN